jgi:regulatory protein
MTGTRGARSGRGWDATPAGRASVRRTNTDPYTGPVQSDRAKARRTDPDARPVADGPDVGRSPDLAERAREICLRLLSLRPRTRAELARALRRHHIPDEVTEQVLERYAEVGMIDDRVFARAWVTSRHHGRGLARRALASELQQKGLAPDTVREALAELSDDVEANTARELVDRRLRGVTASTAGSFDPLLRRLVGLLARKGYQPGLAIRVVRQALAERDIDVEHDIDLDDIDVEADS